MTTPSEFIREIAALTKDGECQSCNQDGDDPNPDCPQHEAWDMPNDDAVETLHGLISQAREIVSGTGQTIDPDDLAVIFAARNRRLARYRRTKGKRS